ncbi:flagellar motor switch protein FliN [Natronogracilivirga saccharolytica]|uniref:Flagellar motor switch protein FliN n=1 Tax=Natronogracilivirga saccharolytica TaxID=2812953 RepID=A0A8J7RIL8_9BACT|nr:flagellar motor switch protein FliN [Natronogracilivirga saccharolytica]MBP3191947.1 flagellar motor switch protein FliN [Natronogracilivirga saccharolytica]
MKLENIKSELEQHLPDVEKFLTSVLQEESKISIVSSENVDRDSFRKDLGKEDIFVFTRDEQLKTDILLILDQEWFGLLSSIMMGVEEKKNNEITRDLLKKFSGELITMLQKKLKVKEIALKVNEIEVLTARQVEKRFNHTEYFHTKMDVSGLADNDVRAEVMIGYPEQTESAQKEEASGKTEAGQTAESSGDAKKTPFKSGQETGKAADQQKKAGGKDFTEMDPDKMGDREQPGREVDESEVISGRRVEFDDFDNGGSSGNGHSHSMALLKDVEMEVSVQLGQIEMPLGKVLQLSKGSIIELDKLAGEPVDILVNGSKIAHGEVIVIDEHFGVRISNLITTRERIAGL